MKKNYQNGFAHLMLVVLLVAVAAIGFASYKVVKDRQDKTKDSTSASTAISSAKPIKTTADLNSAASDLNSQSVDADLNPAQLDSDVNSLL